MLTAKIVKENLLKDVRESQTITIEESSSNAEEKSTNILKEIQKTDTAFGEEETIFQAEETQAPLDISFAKSEPDFCLHENMAWGDDKETLSSAETLMLPETLAMPCQVSPETNLTFSDLYEASTSEMVGNIFLSEEPDILQDLSSGLREQFFDLNIPSIPTMDKNSASDEEMQVSQDDKSLDFYAKRIGLLDDSLSSFTESREFRTFSVETSETTTVETHVPLHCIEGSRAQGYQLYSTERGTNIQPGQMPVHVEGRRPPEYQLHSTERRPVIPSGQMPVQYVEGRRPPEYRLHSTERRSIAQPEEVPMQHDERIQAPPTERDSIAGESLVTQHYVKESQSLLQLLLSTEPLPITQPGEVPVQYGGKSQAHRTVRADPAQRVLESRHQVNCTPIPGHSLHSTERSILQLEEVPMQHDEGIQAPPTERDSIAGESLVTQHYVKESQSLLQLLLSTEPEKINRTEQNLSGT